MKKRDDLDLDYFREKLLKEKERLEAEIAALKRKLDIIAAEDEIDDIEDLAELKTDNDRDHAALKALEQELSDVEEALRKIAEGTYGFDEKTGEPIPKARLEAYPAARTVA